MSPDVITSLSADAMHIRSLIEKTFEENVKGLIPDLQGFNVNHDGAEGDWLTKKMGLSVNGKNEPDFMGFEMKKDSRGKTTFGDWSPDTALYKGRNKQLSRDEFLTFFGTPNAKKSNRYSWSGSVFPKIGPFNVYGQALKVEANQDIIAIYNHSCDQVGSGLKLMPAKFRVDGLEMARWRSQTLKRKLDQKFNQLGWFRCLKDKNGAYERVQFGGPINFANFMALFEEGTIYIDCGMYQGNDRPYMNFRANNKLWNSLAE